MPKKLIAKLKLALPAGKATPSPPVGPSLGAYGVNIAAFCKQYNDQTAPLGNTIIPAEVSIYEDRSFSFVLKTPPTSVLIIKALGVQKGSDNPKETTVGVLSQEQVESIAQQKLPDLNTENLQVAKKIILGTAQNMGVGVE